MQFLSKWEIQCQHELSSNNQDGIRMESKWIMGLLSQSARQFLQVTDNAKHVGTLHLSVGFWNI